MAILTFLGKILSVSLCNNNKKETPTTYQLISVAFLKPAILQENLSKLFELSYMFAEIIICQWQRFLHRDHCPVLGNINLRMPASFGMLSTRCSEEVSLIIL